MMKSLCILLLLSCTILYTRAEPNACCPNNASLVRFQCVNSTELWVRKCQYDAYTITEEEYTVNNDDSITLLPDEIIAKDEYCLGTMDNKNIAMVCFPSPEESTSTSEMTAVAVVICCSISIICLILTLAVYIILPNMRDLQGKCMMFTIFSLLMAFIFLAVVQGSTIDFSPSSCSALAFLIYFWFMCTFFWLNVVSFNMWRSVVRPKWMANRRFLFPFYNVYGWGCPLILLSILLICQYSDGNHTKPNIGEIKCWFHDSQGVRAYFYGPIIALLILNIAMFISTAYTLAQQTKNVTERKYRSHKYKMYLYLKLFIVMGICWIFEPMSEFLQDLYVYLWVVTDYINGLQGLIIFLLLVVFRKRVRRDLAKKGGLCCRGLPKEWATIADEECEELEEDVDELSTENNTRPNL